MDDFDFDFDMSDFEDPKPEPVAPKKSVEDMTSDEILSEFDSLVNSDPEVIAAKAILMEAEAVLSDIAAQRAAKAEAFEALENQRAELQKQLAEITRKMTELNSVANDFRSKEWEANDKKVRASKTIDMTAERLRVQMEAKKQFNHYDDIAKNCAWFNGVTFQDGKTYRIFEQQYIGAKFLASAKRAILADGMGTGKSLQSIAALDLAEAKRVLIVCQSDITTNFDQEVRTWAPNKAVANIRGLPKMQRNAMLKMLNDFSEEFIVIVNFEAWRKDLALVEHLVSMGFDTVIVDEAHNIKDTASVAFRGVRDLCHKVNRCPKDGTVLPSVLDASGNVVKGKNGKEIARICPKCAWSGQSFDLTGRADEMENMTRDEVMAVKYWMCRTVQRIWPMTGTPILNRPQDLYALLNLIDPITFDNQRQFLRSYCIMDPYSQRWSFGPGGMERLARRLKGKYLARTMTDMGITLPEQRPVIHEIDMDKETYPKQAEIIEQITNSAQIIMDSGKALPIQAQIAVILRQRQANVWPGGIHWKYMDPDTKIEHVFEVSEEVRESIKMDFVTNLIMEAVDRGERLVLFSQFKTALNELHMRINGTETEYGNVISSVVFDGETPQDLRTEVKRNFDRKNGEEKKWDIVLAHYKVGGTGLNFTAAVRTIILDEEWNPGKRDQAYARTNRIGQVETTFVDVIRLSKTVDTWLARLIQEKQDMIEGFDSASNDVQAAWVDAFKKGEFNG